MKIKNDTYFCSYFFKLKILKMNNISKTLYNALDHALDKYISALKPFENNKCWFYLKDLEPFNINYVINKIHDINGINNYLIHSDNISSKFIENKPELINSTELILIINCIMKASIDSISEFSNTMNKYKTNYMILLQYTESYKLINETYLLFHTMYNNALCLKNKIIAEATDLNSYKKISLLIL